ncbi:Hypothetical protein SRAE_2000235900 [Strongyloides ratti]|uniref:PSI domain-containing protein n=1 Tax=Strongyloides ratti TaxID=34506 RepID=A0A090LHV3_STRRB|nr:Hypothetical protein SRAE_2000235900 [Strongyloides ratti]CEF67698.1 Hypothetical protein SRAE_2000235900 [Strongyloides ratti]
MMDNKTMSIFLLLIIFVNIKNVTSYIVSDGGDDEIEQWNTEKLMKNSEKQSNCSIPSGKENNCQNCLDIDKSCLWCQSTKSCQKYDGLYQNCDYEDSRILIFIVCMVVFCCICSKMDQCARWNRNRIYLKDNLKLKIQKDSIFKEQEQRKMARKARIDELRAKYGIQLSSPTFTRMNSFRSKKDQSNI